MTGPGRMEKHPLRRAFAGELPDEILWRQKEQFSDGVAAYVAAPYNNGSITYVEYGYAKQSKVFASWYGEGYFKSFHPLQTALEFCKENLECKFL